MDVSFKAITENEVNNIHEIGSLLFTDTGKMYVVGTKEKIQFSDIVFRESVQDMLAKPVIANKIYVAKKECKLFILVGKELIQINANTDNKQDKADVNLNTNTKTVVGAINELHAIFLNIRNVLDDKQKKIYTQDTEPTAAVVNSIWLDTLNNVFKLKMSTGWRIIGAAYN